MTVSAGPARSQQGALLGGAVLLTLVGLATDGGGRLLSWPAALLLVAVVVRDLALGPALRADEAGLVVVTGVRAAHLPWSSVERLRVVTDRRTPLLEVDTGDRLLLLSRWRLGRAPATVLDELQGLAPPQLDVSP